MVSEEGGKTVVARENSLGVKERTNNKLNCGKSFCHNLVDRSE